MELIVTSIAKQIVDSCRRKEWTLNLRIVKIIKETITQSMVMMHTWMMTIDTATKLIALVVIIDDKKQGTHNIKEKPPPTTFTWHILQTTVFARLPFSHTIQQHAHDLMKIACCATFGVRIVGMTVHCGWLSRNKVWDISKEAQSIATLLYVLSKQRPCLWTIQEKNLCDSFWRLLCHQDKEWLAPRIDPCMWSAAHHTGCGNIGQCVPPPLCCWWVWTLKLDCRINDKILLWWHQDVILKQWKNSKGEIKAHDLSVDTT